MRYIYILLICLVIFYLVLIIYQKNITKENFDPSLVPVPAIVTLAKVAQNISDKLGTLINPGNLSIGSYTATAFTDLLVTGNTVINPANSVSNTPNLSVYIDEIVSGNFTNNSLISTSSINAPSANLNGPSTTVTNFNTTNLTVNGNATINGTTNVMDTPGSQINIGKANNAANLLTLNIANNDVSNNGNSTIAGSLQYPNLVASDLNIAGTLNIGGTHFTKNFSNKSSTTTSEISDDATNWNALMILGNRSGTNANGKRIIKMVGDVTVSGSLTVGNKSAVNLLQKGSIMMWFNRAVPLPNGWVYCDGQTNPTYGATIPKLNNVDNFGDAGFMVAGSSLISGNNTNYESGRSGYSTKPWDMNDHSFVNVFGIYFIIKIV
jgi:hypothetical protein